MYSVFAKIGKILYEFTLNYGVVGLGIGTFFESLGIPTAAAVLELAAGSLILQGRTSFLMALIIADLGLTLGSIASYYIGYMGSQTVSRWRPRAVDEVRHSKAKAMLMKYGEISILFAQLFGPARTWISLPAGAMKLDIKRFTIYTAIGGAIYCSIAIGISFYFTNIITDKLQLILRYISIRGLIGLLLGVFVLIIIWIFLRIRNSNNNNS